MNNIFNLDSDLDEVSMISTSSKSVKSDISWIDKDQPNSFKDFGSPINNNFENFNFPFEEKKIDDHIFKKSFKNNFKIKDNLSEFPMDEDFGAFSDKEKGNNDSESSLSILQKKLK